MPQGRTPNVRPAFGPATRFGAAYVRFWHSADELNGGRNVCLDGEANICRGPR